MAQINVCDRCRKALTYRRTIVGIKPRGRTVSVSVFKFNPFDLNNANKRRFYELCDDCGNRLAEFLEFGPTEGNTEISNKEK